MEDKSEQIRYPFYSSKPRNSFGKQNFTAELPDFYANVAEEILCRCQPVEGIWVDLGAGARGIGLPLAKRSNSSIVLIDPNIGALQKALIHVREAGLGKRVIAVAGCAEAIPLLSNCIDLVVSRESIFSWRDKVQGLREAYRILRPGGSGMVGGGLGESYPEWARQEYTRRWHEAVEKRGADSFRRFRESRSSRTFRRLAEEAGLTDFQVFGDGAADPDSPRAGMGIWLLFRKKMTR
jgi:ubiquinone/menaquinone biosynthesis C-methylase UbiE